MYFNYSYKSVTGSCEQQKIVSYGVCRIFNGWVEGGYETPPQPNTPNRFGLFLLDQQRNPPPINFKIPIALKELGAETMLV